MQRNGSAGVLALQGGGPFVGNDELDRELLRAAGIDRVVMLPTADAFEQPARLVDAAHAWGERIGVAVEPLMVMTRADAEVPDPAAAVDAARAVFIAGDSASHLRSVLKDTPLFEALSALLARGGTLIACGPCAAALCDPMTDQRGGGFALGLGLVQGLAVIPGCEHWPREQIERAHTHADTPLVDLPTGSAIVRRGTAWEVIGDATVHGELPHTRAVAVDDGDL
jgi:cyanophycinase-like exopeptidase